MYKIPQFQLLYLSVECSKEQIEMLLNKQVSLPEIEIILYGHLEAMVTKYCPLSLVLKNNMAKTVTAKSTNNLI